MARLTLITDPTQFQRQAHLRRFLQDKSALPPDYLYLVPSQRKVKHTQNWLSAQKGGGWLPSVYTLRRLAGELYSKLGGNKRLINEFTQRVILSSLLTDPDAKWEFFAPEQLTPGLLRRIAGFIAQAKTHVCQDVAGAIGRYRSPAGLQPKDNDLLSIFHHYQQLLAQKSLIDDQDILTETTQLINKTSRPPQLLSRLHTLVLDGFYYFTPLEQEFIKTVIKLFEVVVVSIDCHNPPTGHDHRLLSRYLDFWRALAADSGHTLKPVPPLDDPSPGNRSFIDISQHLFQQPAPAATVPSSGLIIRSLSQRREEVKAIAHDIRQIISHQPDTKLADIYVVFPRMDTYAPLVQELFPRYGIPYEITKGHPLRSSPLTRVILKILAIRLNNCQREDWCALFASELIEYGSNITPDRWADFVLSLGLAPPTARRLLSRPPVGERQLNMPLIDTLARRANLQGGADWRGDWLVPLLKTIRTSELEVEQQAEAYCQLYLLQQAWAEFDRLPPRLTCRQFSQGLLELVRRFGVLRNIIAKLGHIYNYTERDRQIILKRQIRALDKLHSLLQQLASALEVVGRGETRLPLAELYSLFLGYLTTEEYHLTDHTEDRVQIVEPLELRGLYFEHLFWGGLVEEEFPRPEVKELFYPSGGRKRLFSLLPRLDEDRYLFSYIFKNTRRRITLSYPLNHQGKPLLPSPFIEELKQVAHIDVVESSPAPVCYTRQELLCRMAADWSQGSLPLTLLKALKRLDTEAYFQLLHLLEVDSLRRSSSGFSPYEGMLASPASLARLKQLNPEARYAVTQLEEYALCPLSYFFKYILRLKPVEEIVDEFQPQDRGRLLHKILEDFYRRRIERYRRCPEQIRITPANLEAACRQMLHCARRVLDGFRTKYNNLFWQQEKDNLLAGLETGDDQQPPGLLRAFLEHEAQSGHRLIPGYVEFCFGQAGSAPALRLGGLKLAGRVDRIDLAPDEGLAVVYDYKFGSVPNSSLIRQGLSFQLPVYMLAVAEYLKDKGYQIGAGGYYQLKSTHQINKTGYFGQQDIRVRRARELGDGKVLVSSQSGYGFLPADEFRQQLEQVQARLIHIHQLITAGRFHPPLGPEDVLPCRFCDYARICRLDAVRLANMHPGLSDREHYKPLRKG
jgi:ATP-dependent helicase/DNAse subunit B